MEQESHLDFGGRAVRDTSAEHDCVLFFNDAKDLVSGAMDIMVSLPSISIHFVPLAMLSLSPEEAARTPLQNHTGRSRESAQTLFSPTQR
jgi:hypothetical protein